MTPRFVIAGTGRSGSGYISRLLRQLGVDCGHEEWWNPHGRQRNVEGDASWLAVPFLDSYEGRVFHQVRDPIRVIDSLRNGEMFRPQVDEYRRFADEHTPGGFTDDLEGTLRFVARWIELCERRAELTWKVEDVGPDLLVDLCGRVGHPVTAEQAEQALRAVPKTVNRHGPKPGIRWDSLPDTPESRLIRDFARRWGYPLEAGTDDQGGLSGVMVGWIDGGTVDGSFCESLLGLVTVGTLNRQISGWVRYQSGPVLNLARNKLADQFLESPAQWLLSIDSDMVFQPDLADRLLADADPVSRPIVGAVCYGMTRELGVFPAVYKVGHKGFYIWQDFPEDLVQVDAVGAGCTLIHRSAYERIAKVGPGRWYDPLMAADRPVGEDLSFCLRAKAAGVDIWADGRIPVRHLKVKAPLDRGSYQQWRTNGALTVET